MSTVQGDPNDRPHPQAQNEDSRATIPHQPTNRPRGIRQDPDSLRIGEATEAVFQELYPGWDTQSSDPATRALKVATSAHIAAAALGRKPLYFEAWGEALAPSLASVLRPVIPPSSVVTSSGPFLYVYRPGVVIPILDADPAFYRPHGQDTFAAIHRATLNDRNGELLGYGARYREQPGGVSVFISDAEHNIIHTFFVSNPVEAPAYGALRAQDLTDYTGQQYLIRIQSR